MMEHVLDSENLREAWRRVRANAGAAGMDGMSVKDFPAFARKHWLRIRTALMCQHRLSLSVFHRNKMSPEKRFRDYAYSVSLLPSS